MTTLGAKPNHAFFNCQHPSRKKSARRPSNAPRSGREIRRTRLPGDRARSQLASACRKRNVVFKVVLSTSHCARRGCGPSRAPLATTQRRQRPKDKRIDPEIFPTRLFFAPHKPDCADLRELQKALRAIRGAFRARRNDVDDMRADAFTRIEAAIDPRASCAPRCVEQTIRDSRARRKTILAPRGQRKSRPRSRGRLRRPLLACPMTRARGNDDQWSSSSSSSA